MLIYRQRRDERQALLFKTLNFSLKKFYKKYLSLPTLRSPRLHNIF